MKILSFAQFGYEGEIVKVETDLRRGIPAMDIVGLPDGAVKEARERVRAAIRNANLEFPKGRVLINLSPANLKKEGSAFDLPIALSVLAAEAGWDELPEQPEEAEDAGGRADTQADAIKSGAAETPYAVMVLGELELSGAVRKARGISAAVAKACEEGIRTFILPEENLRENLSFPDAEIHSAATLTEAYAIIRRKVREQALRRSPRRKDDGRAARKLNAPESETEDKAGGTPVLKIPTESAYSISWGSADADSENGTFADIHGQPKLLRALQIAAAGGHHIIAYGAPGCGKTMAFKRFPSILPDLDAATASTRRRIYSIAGISEVNSRTPPFRMPHQTCSLEGMAGGGRNCTPGEISLAHGGALFLDETALFRANVLQALRAPLESGKITLSRAGRQTTFPARFQLLAAMNPCPCGKFGVPGKICTCTHAMIEKYWQQLTEPLLDRLDLRVEVPLPDTARPEQPVTQEEFRKPIGNARLIQWRRNRQEGRAYAGQDWLNAYLKPAEISAVCALSKSADGFVKYAAEKNKLSGRSIHNLIKTARTIADMESEPEIKLNHLEEALFFRTWSPSVPDFLS